MSGHYEYSDWLNQDVWVEDPPAAKVAPVVAAGLPALAATQPVAPVVATPVAPVIAAAATPDFANMPGLSFGGFGGANVSATVPSATGYVSPYSQSEISKYVDMSLDGKDHSNDAGYNAFLNDKDFQNAMLTGVAGQQFNLGLTAQDMAADFDYNKPTEHGLLGWQSYQPANTPAHAATDTNYWDISANKVTNAPQSLIDQAKANPGKPVQIGSSGLGDSTGYIWQDGALREAQYVHNSGTGLAGALPIILSMVAPGVGTAIGSALGAGATLAPIVGGAILGGGSAALTGGDILKGAALGGLGGASSVQIGDTGATLGQVNSAVNIAKNLDSGNLFGAITGAANIAGAGNTQIGETGLTINDLSKDVNLAKAVISGNPQALMGALTSVASSATNSSNDANNLINQYTQTGAGTGAATPDYASNDVGTQQLIDALTNTPAATGQSVQVASAEPDAALTALQERIDAQSAAPAEQITVPTQAEQQPAVEEFIKQIEQHQAPEQTVEQIMAAEPPAVVNQAAPVEQQKQSVLDNLKSDPYQFIKLTGNPAEAQKFIQDNNLTATDIENATGFTQGQMDYYGLHGADYVAPPQTIDEGTGAATDPQDVIKTLQDSGLTSAPAQTDFDKAQEAVNNGFTGPNAWENYQKVKDQLPELNAQAIDKGFANYAEQTQAQDAGFSDANSYYQNADALNHGYKNAAEAQAAWTANNDAVLADFAKQFGFPDYQTMNQFDGNHEAYRQYIESLAETPSDATSTILDQANAAPPQTVEQIMAAEPPPAVSQVVPETLAPTPEERVFPPEQTVEQIMAAEPAPAVSQVAPEEPVTVPTQAEQQPAVENFIKQLEQYQAPEPTVEQILASEPPPAGVPAETPTPEVTPEVQALIDQAVTGQQESAQAGQPAIDQQTQQLLSDLSGGTDTGVAPAETPRSIDNQVAADEQAKAYAEAAQAETNRLAATHPDPVQALIDQVTNTDQPAIDQQTQDLLNELSGGTDNGVTSPIDYSGISDILSGGQTETPEEDIPTIDVIGKKEPPTVDYSGISDILSGGQTETPPIDYSGISDMLTGGQNETQPTEQTPAVSIPKIPVTPATKTPAVAPVKTVAPVTKPAAVAQATALVSAIAQGYMPSVGDVAHIKSLESLFGPLLGEAPPEPAHEKKDDSLSALEGMDQEYASGGHVDDFSVEALLHILRS